MSIIGGVAATLVTVPFIALYLIYIVTVKVTKNKGVALRAAADGSLLFFVLAVHFFILEIWGLSLIQYIFAVMLFLAIIFTFVHWRKYEDIRFFRIAKGVWRFQFVLFLVLYVVLAIVGSVLTIAA
ncbi:DUF3397 domain-containing protein [Alteribacter natronophilus]|uniref:DUF3397 domain-containing protein n=1 Tax=Alteribacter natronophilus TaxID=2583810 RepID=UPI00110E431C|nr:DUF3397 domain-containing protein [Alteribacter natronophilus]TMW73115.1 DUF3397 domain-containing protein [Alteribacter natronophilus]